MIFIKKLASRVVGFLAVIFLLQESGIGSSKPKVVVIRKASPDYQIVSEGLKRELERSYELGELTIAKDTSFDEVRSYLENEKPSLMVLMDNQSIDFGMQYNAKVGSPNQRIKGLGMMGLNLGNIIQKSDDLAGIAYESPAYSLVTQFRFVVEKPIKKVTVLYRKKFFSNRIEEARQQLGKEKIVLHAVAVDDSGDDEASIRSRLEAELEKVKQTGYTDAVWVLLDSVLLKPQWFKEIWTPIARGAKAPFLVETETLARKDIDFGTFATTPNLQDLVGQAVQIVDAIALDGTSPKEIGVESVVSVNKILNKARITSIGINIKSDNLDDVKVIE